MKIYIIFSRIDEKPPLSRTECYLWKD